MTTWLELYGSQAVYESDVIDISSDFEYYVNDLRLNYDENDGFVKVELRITHDDGFTWSDWVDVKSSFYHDIFYTNDIKLNHTKMQYRVVMNLLKKGISPVFRSFEIDLYGAFKINNTGDLSCLPEIWLKKTNGAGDIHLINETTGQEVVLENINNNETVYIDCYNEDIMTDLPMTYRYDNHNEEFLELQIGENVITGYGDFEFVVRHEFRVLQG